MSSLSDSLFTLALFVIAVWLTIHFLLQFPLLPVVIVAGVIVLTFIYDVVRGPHRG